MNGRYHVVPAVAMGLALCLAAAAQDASKLRLVPMPRVIRLKAGTFALGEALVLEAPAEMAGLLGRQLGAELKLAGLPAPAVRAATKGSRFWRLSAKVPKAAAPPALEPPRGATDEAYSLDVGPDGGVCAAAGQAGLFYGLATFCQLVRANRVGKAVPCLTVRDRPALRWRCFQDDMTRGPSSRLETLRRQAALGATLKMNLFTYYMEYQYAFRKHPLIGPKNGSLTGEDLKALVAFAKGRYVDVLGNQQSFGHFERILKHERYANLRETPGILCPVNEDSYRLLDDLYSEVCPLLPFEMFNVCCDETWGLGTGPSKALAKEIGVGGVYVRHIRRVHDLLKDKYAKRMMMWGDIILQHPKHLKEIPTDTIMLTWGYHPGKSFEGQIIPFAKSGYEFFVCPGVSNWSRILPDFGVATVNIRNFVRDGVKHGALGMLNTAWEDDGEAINAPKWHGYAWGAECAWTGSKTTPEDFNRRIGAVLFGEKSDHFGRAIELLARTHRLAGMGGMNNGRFWQDDFKPSAPPAAIRRRAKRLLDIVRPAIEHLDACRADAVVNADLLDGLLLGARRMEFIGQRMLDGLAAAEAYTQACDATPDKAAEPLRRAETLVRKNRDACEALGKEFRRLWLIESKPYALDWTMKRYAAALRRSGALAAQIAAARKLAEAGKPIPPPEKLGLSLVEGLFRRTRPQRLVKTPMGAEAPWRVPEATHRMGLAVQAGGTGRTDLPIELDLTVPADLTSKPVRALRSAGAGADPREVPAQLDASGKPGKARLTYVIAGELAKGKTAAVWLYLGLPKPPAPLPAAATTRDAKAGMKWLENDKLRLLLAPEGGHIYRWLVKAADDRDLTMPGTTDWAGFADMGGQYRGATHKLTCTARGPALVRYTCAEPDSGLVKAVSLFAGASWVEVTLSEPAERYWEFDNPKNFAADGPSPGAYLFSNGKTGRVGRQADGLDAQVHVKDVFWSVKHNARLALGLVTPEAPAFHHVAPGDGAGGVGIEASRPVNHFITYGGVLAGKPRELMERLSRTLSFRAQPHVTVFAVQKKPDGH